ncbi:unnamed protein product [Symbiodinium sp. CCMP2592]|nr:unnamed protein product [Symbiodinium sp. CCMP2592]
MSAKSAAGDKCKWCCRSFRSPNPLVMSPKPDDYLPRRTPLSKECRSCFTIQSSDPELSKMDASELQQNLGEQSFRDSYLQKLENWEELRRQGKRQRVDKKSTAVIAEQSTSLETRQVLGYLWPKALLKQEKVDFQHKKLTTIEHAGRRVKGLLRQSWTLGAIEVLQTAAKTAKRQRVESVSDGEADGEGSGGETKFAAMQQQVRARVSENKGDNEEVALRMPAKSQSLEDDLTAILWGGVGGGGSSAAGRDHGSTSGGEIEETRVQGRTRQAKRGLESFSGRSAQPAPGSSASQASHPQPVPKSKSRKQAAESRELDKSEALVLQATQLIGCLQCPESFMSVQLQKATSLLKSLKNRLSEESWLPELKVRLIATALDLKWCPSAKKYDLLPLLWPQSGAPDLIGIYSEAVRRDGSGEDSRAAVVWEGLKEKIAMVEAAVSFVEALHDEEASAGTLSTRAAALRAVGVKLPKNVNMVVCRREIEAKIYKNEFAGFFDFLNPDKVADNPNGISAVMNGSTTTPRDDPEIFDFQVGSLVQALNSMLLTCWKDPTLEGCDSTSSAATHKQSVDTDSAASKEEANAKARRALDASVGRIAKFFQVYNDSFLATVVAESTTNLLQDDIRRLSSLVTHATSEQELSMEDCDIVGGHKAAMIKNKQGSFHKSLTLFPVGIHLMETISEKINRVKREQLLHLDLATAANIAQELKAMTVDTLLKASKDKDKGSQGELEVCVPSSSKVIDMTTKWLAASEASATFVSQNKERLHVVEQKILELKGGLLSVVATKTRDYEKIDGFLNELCLQKGLSQDDVASCSSLLSNLAACQPLHKLASLKFLGKVHAQELEACMNSSWKLFTCLSHNFEALVKLTTVPASEGGILHQKVIDLYVLLHDDAVIQSVGKTAPWFNLGLQAAQGFLEGNAKDWIATTAATFLEFTFALLQTEPNYEEIFNNDTNFAQVADFEEGSKVDFVSVSSSLVKPLRSGPGRSMKVIHPKKDTDADAQTQVDMHVSFICMCGVLAQISKYVRSLKTSLQKAEEAGIFNDVLDLAVGALKAQDKTFVFRSRASILGATAPILTHIAQALQQFDAVANDSKKDDITFASVEAYYKWLTAKIQEQVGRALNFANNEVAAIVRDGRSLYETVASKHGAPELFQAESLNKQAIQALVSDPAGQKVALFAARASESLSSVRQWLSQSLRHLPQGSAISSTCLSLVSAIEADIDSFQASGDTGKTEGGVKIVNLRSLQGLQISMTMAQAMVRDLGGGETRIGLVSRCHQLALSKSLCMDPVLLKKAQSMLNLKGK